jgi:pimeloyl-ACP methyl ester carboxylesterase
MRVDGRRLHWIETGRGRPVVLLHGLGDTGETWSDVAAALAGRYRVLAVDLPGFGRSEASCHRPLLEGFTRVLAEWLDAVAPEPVILVGHSMGGSAAAHLAGSRPDLLSGLVLVAPAGIPRIPLWWRLIAIQRPVRRLLGRALGAWPPARTRTPPATPDEIGRLLETAHALIASLAPAPPVPPSLSSLVIWGRRDRLVPNSYAALVAKRYAARLVMVDASGHSPHVEQPAAFLEAMHEFLETVPLSPAPGR